MHSSSHTLISTRPRPGGRRTFQALVLALLVLIPSVLALAIPRGAKAAGAPTVTKVEPSNGPLGGGISVRITGTNLTGATKVKFGATEATSFSPETETSMKAVAPAGTGTVDVTVTTTETSVTSPADHFTYVPAPTVTEVKPNSGPLGGGPSVTITGTDLTGVTKVKFGATDATSFTPGSSTSMTAVAPAGTGTVDVTVTATGGTSAAGAADHFTYVPAPTVTKVEPGSGPAAGGTSVTITGTDLTGVTAVKFGSTNATSFTPGSSTSMTAVAPAGTGTVDMTVTATGGTSAAGLADQFAYVPAPTVTEVKPNSGPLAGGTTVTITGTNLTGASAVEFGSTNATSFKVESGASVTAVAPAGTGKPDVTVTTSGGTSATGPADQFTYLPVPTVSKVEPSSGPAAGGTSVTITGTGFTPATTVKFGSASATGVLVSLSSTSITAISPAGTGTVDVTVTTAGGSSPTSSADQFTYTTSPSSGEKGSVPTIVTGNGPVSPVSGIRGRLPAPVLAQSADVAPVVGRVLVRLPGTRGFVALTGARQIPYGTIVDATYGEVSITAAALHGGTQTGDFFDGQFRVTQGSNGKVVATLTSGDFSVCRRGARAAGAELAHTGSRRAGARRIASPTHLARRLWATAQGSFSTKGKYAAGSVRGAQWLTEDMCQGTLILATRERVEVTDLVRHRRIDVSAGQIYIAKPR
jgi:IPT/TIG domain